MPVYKIPKKSNSFSLNTEPDEIETLAPPEDNNQISQINSAMAGIASRIIKVPESVISLVQNL